MRFLFLLAAFLVVGKTALSQRTSSQADNLIPQDEGEKRVVCYYTNWSVYRQGRAKFTPQNINPYLCTHLVYAFGGLTDEFEVSTFDSYQDIEQGGYAKFNGLKQYNKNMKTLLAIGGWNEGSSRFSELVSLKEYRDNFTLSAIKHLRRYNFDGLDLDWEYPGSRDGSAPEDKENYALLVKELREAFELERTKSNKWRLLLTMAVPAGQVTIDKGFDVPTLNKYLDFINLLTYDYHSVYEPSVNHHSALFAPPGTSEYELNAQLNVDWTIKYYISKGASKNKLVLGIPTYGRSYTLLDGGFYGFGSSADGPGTKGNDTNEKGYLAFYEICEAVALEEWTVKKPFPKRMGPFAFKGNQWVGYDDEKIAAKKAEYVSENGLGGIMFWAIDSDDFRGVCNGEKYPLVEAAKRALFASSKPSGNKVTEPDQLTDSSPGRRKQPNKQGQRRLPNSKPDVDIHPLSTPEPPSTPSSIKGFNCKKQGFFPHPDSCNQYYWCLDSGASGLGIVAHGFTCPSNLIFNKKIDGCDHPDRVKCKVGAAGRGGSKSDPTTTPIPTTTEFDYTLIQDFDYYYDYEEPLIEPVEEKAIDIKIEQPIEENVILPKNSGGPQFEVSSITDTKDEISQKSQIHSFKDPTDRTRPGYSSIQRERPKVRDQPINVDQEIIITEVEDIQSNRPNRPQYVTLNRQSSSDSLVPEDKNLFDALNIDTTTEKDALEYVTINRRRRPTVTPVSLLEEEAVTKLGPEYVTLHRLRPVTTATETPLSSPLDFDPVAENPSETLFEEIVTTTTTTEKPTKRPRIRIPSVLRSSGPSPRPAQTHRRRPERTRSRSQVEEIKEAVPEEIKFERPLQRENKDTEAVIPEEKLGSNRQRNRFQKRPRLRQRPVIHEEKVLQDTNTAATIEIAHEKLQDLTNEATDLTEKDSIQVKLEEEIQTQEVVSQKKKEAHPQREEVLTHSNKEVIIKENIPDEIKDEGAINIKEEKLNDQEKQVGEEKAAQSKTSDNLETILEEIEASLDAGESPVEEAFLLFQQNAKNSTVDSNQTESIARHEALEIITSTSTAIIDTTKATTQIETSTIPVELEEPKIPSRTRLSFEERTQLRERVTPRDRIPQRDRTPPRGRIPIKDRISPRNRTKEETPSTERTQIRDRIPSKERIPPRNRGFSRDKTPLKEELSQRDKTSSKDDVPLKEQILPRDRTPQRVRTPPNPRLTFQHTTAKEEPLSVENSFISSSTTLPTISFIDIISSARETSTDKPELIHLPITSSDIFEFTFKTTPSPEPATSLPIDIFSDVISQNIFENKSPVISVKDVASLQEDTPTLEEVQTIKTPIGPIAIETLEPISSPISPPKLSPTLTRKITPFTIRPQAVEPNASRPKPIRPTTSPIPKLSTALFSDTQRSPRPKSSTGAPSTVEYELDYYYYDEQGALGGSLGQLASLSKKAVLLPDGQVECSDTGYFPHPESCKKFISCSKTVKGFLGGWIYTCPQDLVFDPVGGMCNWSEDVDCLAAKSN